METQTHHNLRAKDFEQVVNGRQVRLFTLVNASGCEATVTNYGARIVTLHVPACDGRMTDVVLGKSTLDEYLNDQEPYLGAICGRTANRIANARFTLDGIEYRLAANAGQNSLHGGPKGFHTVVWDAEQVDRQTLRLSYLSPDGEEGYPGNLRVEVLYRLTDDNSFKIDYKAVTDRPTILNLTNHSYFNLSGEGCPSIDDHQLIVAANDYLPTDADSIPLGPVQKVTDTPFDFCARRPIGDYIDSDDIQLRYGKGYDHNYVFYRSSPIWTNAAIAISPRTGILLSVRSIEPGMQFYTGNYLDGSFIGKNGHTYPRRSAFCLETQHYPDSIHHPEYPSTVLRPGEEFASWTTFRFGLREDLWVKG
jgi:aldose 1-epimerase